MKNPLIIEQPRLQSLAQEFGWASVTLIFWLIYFYLWLPLLTLFAWYFSVKLFDMHIIELKGYASFLELLKYYLIVIVSLGVALIGWAKIEYLRFSNNTSRKTPKAINIQDVSEFYQVPTLTLASLRKERVVNVHFSDNGSISHFSRPMELAIAA